MKAQPWAVTFSLGLAALLMACSPSRAGDSTQPTEPEPTEQNLPSPANTPGIVLSTAQPAQATLALTSPALVVETATAASLPTLKGSGDFAPLPEDHALERGAVYLTNIEVLSQSGGEVTLLISGSLPSPCHALRIAPQPPEAGKIVLEMYSVTNPKMMCVTMLKEFEAQYRLQISPAGTYQVWVNGQMVGETHP